MKYYNNNFEFDVQLQIAESNFSPFYYDFENKIKLYNLDTFSFLPHIPDNCVDLIFTDPPPNLTRRYFTHASEHLIWAAKTKQSRHTFNYERLKTISNGETIKSVWRDIWKMPSVDYSEKVFGKHPTQKPEGVIKRAILASSNDGDLVFDPFCGSGTTGVVCKKQTRKFVGIDNNIEYLNIAKKRLASTNNRNN